MDTMEKTSSQDQSASLGSEHNENYEESSNDTKPGVFACNHGASQAEVNQPLVQVPYAYFDPFMNGSYAAYATHTMIQPQGSGAVSGRVALPVDPSEDAPIYVNAKQYHGILRRRQMRAKLEAKNKLVKTRKPYLHESRHVHALNRVRGSGGRFLSTNKTQDPDPRAITSSQHTGGMRNYYQNRGASHGDAYSCRSGTNDRSIPPSTEVGTVCQRAQDERFSSIITTTHMAVSTRGGSGLVCNGNSHFASVVR